MSNLSVFEEQVHDLVGHPGEMREHTRSVTLPEAFGESLARVAAGETMRLKVRLESVHEGILATVEASSSMTAECGRCLREFSVPLEIDFQELFAYTPSEAEEYSVQGFQLNLEPPLRDAVVLALPFQPVCSNNCPGLDPETGELRSTEGAAEPAVVDPRWAALAELLVEEKDVSADSGA